MIVGIDEVGRGPWAGPLVVGAVVLGDANIDGLADSKKLTKRRREELSRQIIQYASAWGLGWVAADELDRIGLSAALTVATKRALEQIKVPYHEIIIDGTVNFLQATAKGNYVTTLKKADMLIASVSAASIIAKVARDDYMADQDDIYTGYGFASHVGYGTARHRQAIAMHGLTPLHRRSFAPVAAIECENSSPVSAIGVSPTSIGSAAENVAAMWLEARGYEVVERNWKTRFCEIDIIAMKEGTCYFIEVKHRRNKGSGSGLEAVTPRKLRQMAFATGVYAAYRRFDKPMQLAALATIGDTPTVTDYVEIGD